MALLISFFFLVDFSELVIQANQSAAIRLAILAAGAFVLRGRELVFVLFYGLFTVSSFAAVELGNGELTAELAGRSRFLLLPMAVAIGMRFRSGSCVNLPFIGSLIIIALVFNIAASLLGLGMTQYGLTEDGSPVAVKGAYTGGNEVSILYVLAVIFLIHGSAYRSLRYGSVVILISIGVGLWLGTKTAVVFSIISAIALFGVFSARVAGVVTKGRFRSRVYAGSSFLLAVSCILILMNSNLGIGNRFDTLMSKVASDYSKVEDIASVATSGRLVVSEEIGRAYIQQVSPISLMLGFGWMGGQKLYSSRRNKQVESDPIDIMIAFGVVGIGCIYGYWFVLLMAAIKNKQNTLVVAIMVLLCLSIIPGHVMYSSLAPMVLGLVLGNRLSLRRRESQASPWL